LASVLLFSILVLGGASPATTQQRPAAPATRSPAVLEKWNLWTNGTVLRGANVYQQDESLNDIGGRFGPHLVREDLRALRSAGANYVNFSVPGIFHVKSNGPWPEMAAHLETMVSWARAENLFVVISVRTGPGRGEGDITPDEGGLKDRSVFNDTLKQAAWAEMWKQIARRYGAEPHVVGFDLMVEPHDVPRAEWRAFAQRMVDSIRSVDSVTPILVSPAEDWGTVSDLVGWTPINGQRIVYTVHQYEPRRYTHGRARSYSHAALAELYRQMRTWLTHNPGQRLAVNEFGVKKHKPHADQFLVDQLRLLEQLGVNHAAWLWEVSDTTDPSYAPQFDFKRVPAQMQAFRDNWRRNTVFPPP
jgi:hypothetical protein